VLVGDVMTTTIFPAGRSDSIGTALNLMGARNLVSARRCRDANGCGASGHARFAHHAAGERLNPARGWEALVATLWFFRSK
jgi:hypothetical protein